MGFGIRGEDQEVIHIDEEPSFGYHVAERVVHESLERGGGIGHPEEHYERLEESSVCGEGAFPLVSVLNSDIVVPPPDVEFSEEFSSLELINEVGDEGEGIGIADGVLVKVPIVLTGA